MTINDRQVKAKAPFYAERGRFALVVEKYEEGYKDSDEATGFYRDLVAKTQNKNRKTDFLIKAVGEI